MGTTKAAVLVSDPAFGDPYEPASDYLDLAMRAALGPASDDPSGYRWRDAIFAIGIAQMGLPAPTTSTVTSPLTCLDLAKAARNAYLAVPVDQHTADHVLRLAYLEDALRAVQAATADEATEA